MTSQVHAADEYTDELQCDRRQAVWEADLSDGRTVTMDDGRPGVEPSSAWLRLREHVRETGVRVRNLRLRFRSVVHSPLPQDADGYFFAHQAGAHWGSDEVLEFMLVGYLKNGLLVVQQWSVPELIHLSTGVRDPEAAGLSLLVNPACLDKIGPTSR